ncbi:MAG: glycosyltransferase [Methanothrix sp.]|nr:glycosyltransferase [Methanothrix sp.]
MSPNNDDDSAREIRLRGIKYISFYERSGYGCAARAYLRGLMKTDIPLTWTPMVPARGLNLGHVPFPGRELGDPDLDSVCNLPIRYDTVILHLTPEYYPQWLKRETGKRMIGYTVWETDKLPGHWPALLNIMDRILVPSQWNRDIFIRGGVKRPISVIPHIAANFDQMRSQSNAIQSSSDLSGWGIGANDYVFYNIGMWTARKALSDTIQCYLNSFSGDDNALLLIKTTKYDYTKRYLWRFFPHTDESVRRIVKNYKNPARVEIINEEISQEDIFKLHARGDCYFSLCRSEGWGLGAFDAASLGKPIIITGYGGQTEYLPGHLAYLVNYRLVPVIDVVGKRSYSRDQMWAEPNRIHASQLIRQVFEGRRAAHQRAVTLSEHIRMSFGESTIIPKLIRAIKPN